MGERIMTTMDIAHRELAAARAIRAKIATMTDDAETIRDTLDGEVDLQGIVRALVLTIAEEEAAVAANTALSNQYLARRSNIDARIETLRGLVGEAMELAEWKSLKLDIATISLRPGTRKVQVTDETQIPAAFWRTPEPVIDKKELLDALKDGQQIHGATLSNGGMIVTIRRA